MKTKSVLSIVALAALGVVAVPQAAVGGESARLLAKIGFEEVSGSFSDDADSGLSAALTPSARWATGSFGGALATGGRFAGAHVTGLSKALDGAEAFSLFLRFRKDGDGTGKYPCLLSTPGWGDGGMLLFSDGKSLALRLRAGTKGPEGSWLIFGRLPERKWHSVAVVFQRPTVTVYADGKRVGGGKWDHPFRLGGTVLLGGWYDSSFGGFIDDFRVWKGAVGAEAIAELAGDSRYDELEGYQDDGTGGARKTEIVGQVGQTAATLAGDMATLTFDTLGRVVSLKEKASGRELVTNAVPFVSVTTADGTSHSVRRMKDLGKGRLLWSFAGKMGEVELSVEPFAGGWTFKVERCTVQDVACLSFCRVNPVCRRWNGGFANACSDERSAVCVRSYDVKGVPRLNGAMRVDVEAPFPAVGRRAGLAAGPREGFREQLKAMTVAAGVPRSDCGGAWSMGSEVARWSYVFVSLHSDNVDYWIDFVKRSGFANIHISSDWTSCLGHCPINRRNFPEGLDGMKAAVAKIHDAGLHAGMHTLTACINPNDPWIRPVCREELVADATYTLAAPLDEKATEMLVNEMPIKKHALVFTYSSNGNVFRIGNELIQYTGIRRDKAPYAFTGLKRGAFGTKKGGVYPAGTKADYLHQRYIAFYPKPDSALADELADGLANVYNTCDLEEFYFDGSEGMGTRYGIDVLRHKIFSRLKSNRGHSPSTEASCGGANNWWFQTRMATTDHGVYGVKRFHDWHVRWAIDEGRQANFLEPQMGWWQPRVDVPRARGHMLDEMEYFAGKNAGHDAAMSIQGVGARPLPIGVRRQLTLLGWYEYPRLARAFDAEAKARLAKPGSEARLRQNGKGVWELTGSEEFAHRAGLPWERAWTVESATARKAALRVEALYAAGAEKDAVPLLNADDFKEIATRAASGVKVALATDVTGSHGTAFRLSATNAGAPQNGSWAEAKRKFAFPGLDLGGNRLAFGCWVKGDGSGALLNLQLATTPEFHHCYSDHHVRLDFTGWRHVTFMARERDSADYHRYRWPYNGTYSIYRNFLDPRHIASFTAYLNDVPKGGTATVEIAEVKAMPAVAVALENVAVTVSGKTFTVPFKMTSGDYAELDGGFWTHFSAMGTALARQTAEEQPQLAEGRNDVAFAGGEGMRAQVTLFALDEARPAFVEELTADMRKTMRYEGMMPFEYAPAKGLLAPETIPIRPGEEAGLSVDVYGPAENPTFTFPGFLGMFKTVCTFPVAIGADERLVCRDGVNWKVEKAKDGSPVREGKLEEPLPTLGKTAPFEFTAKVPEDAACMVDILKVYR